MIVTYYNMFDVQFINQNLFAEFGSGQIAEVLIKSFKKNILNSTFFKQVQFFFQRIEHFHIVIRIQEFSWVWPETENC